MTGIGGDPSFNYKDFFQQHEAGKLKSYLDAGQLDNQKLFDAAFDSLDELALQFANTHSPVLKNKYLDLAQKFSQIFPEQYEEIRLINDFTKNHIEGVKKPQQHTLDELGDEKLWQEVDVVLQENLVEPPPAGLSTRTTASESSKEALQLSKSEMEELLRELDISISEFTPPPGTIAECKNAIAKAKASFEIQQLIDRGADKKMVLKAASEMVKQQVLDTSLSPKELQQKLRYHFGLMGYDEWTTDDLSSNISNSRDQYIGLLTNASLPDFNTLSSMKSDLEEAGDTSIIAHLMDAVKKGQEAYCSIALESVVQQLRWFSLAESSSSTLQTILEDYNYLITKSEQANIPIPDSAKNEFHEKVSIPIYQTRGSPHLQKALAGKLSELSIEEFSKLPAEINSFDLPVPDQLQTSVLIEGVFNFVSSHQDELKAHPERATLAHQILHEFAQQEVAQLNKIAFAIEARAAAAIPLSTAHPLHDMDEAILAGPAKQLNPKSGAHFSSFDTSIVKGGNLHASQRTIDGKLLNCFDFKVSHYARDELTKHLQLIRLFPEEFKASLPPGFCSDVKISPQIQQFVRFDESMVEYTRTSGYSPKYSKATEIVFEGAGKIIIGETKENGCMYNWIQVEMEANLPPGEGAKKLQQILAVSGLGPVIGQQPPEADERMKIAQLFRAFYPSAATSLDVTKEFYQFSIEELKDRIIAKEPGMEEIFKKYLETSPELMFKIEIMPGKEIWGVKDLGQLMKANGAWGVMSGVGNSGGWESAKKAVEKILTQGALSSEQRYQAGIFKAGASSESDLFSGGGDQVFTRLINDKVAKTKISTLYPFVGTAQILWNLETAAQRVPYGYEEDKYGIKNRFHVGAAGTYDDYQTRSKLLDFAGNAHHSSNEMMFKNALHPSYVQGVVVNDQVRKDDLIEHLIRKGLAEKDVTDEIYIKFAGKRVKADEFIHVGTEFKKEWWG